MPQVVPGTWEAVGASAVDARWTAGLVTTHTLSCSAAQPRHASHYERGASAARARTTAMLTVWPWRKLRVPTGPISPAKNMPATGISPPSARGSKIGPRRDTRLIMRGPP